MTMYRSLNTLTQLMIQLFYTIFVKRIVTTDYLTPWQFATIWVTYQRNRKPGNWEL